MLWTPDSNAHEALGYRFTFVRSEVSVTDSNSLMSDGRVHIVYKYVEGISRLKQKSKRPRPPALRAAVVLISALRDLSLQHICTLCVPCHLT